jgi:hypothetical protein
MAEGKEAKVVTNIKHRFEIWKLVEESNLMEIVGQHWFGVLVAKLTGRNVTTIWQNITLQCNEVQHQTNSVSVREEVFLCMLGNKNWVG